MTSANSAALVVTTTSTAATTTGAGISDGRSRRQLPRQHFRSRSYLPAPARSSACASMTCTTTDTPQHFSLPALLAAPGFSTSPVVPAVAFPSNWPPQHAWVPVAWWNSASGHVLVATEEGWRLLLLLQQMADESPPPTITTSADGENQSHEEPPHPTLHQVPQPPPQG